MRILLAQNSLYYPAHGGGDKSNRLLMEALAVRGHACRVVARIPVFGPAEQARYVADLAARGTAPVPRVPGVVEFERGGVEVRVVANAGLRAYFDSQVEEFRPGVILTSTDDPSQLLLEAALGSTARVVYLARATLALPFGPDCAFPSRIKTGRIRAADAVVGVSEYVARYVREYGGIGAVHVPISLIEPAAWPYLGRFDNEFVVMVNPCAVKGVAIFLALADAYPETAFAAVPMWGTNREDRAALAARANVSLLDPVDDIDALWARTRVLLVPSLWAEARSRIAPEAMLRGIPVLAANVGGIPEAMMGVPYLLPVNPIVHYQPQVDEQMVPVADAPPQNIAPWRDALARLLRDRAHYEELSRASRAAAIKYAQTLTVAPFESLLEATQLRPKQGGAGASACPSPISSLPLERLSPDKRRLLALRLRQRAPAAAWFPGTDAARGMRLFCFPYAGGGAGAYAGWRITTPPATICPVRLPGREARSAEAPFERMAPLADALAAAIQPYLDLPFAFFGHSMGALVAFELARRLRRSGLPQPRLLIASAARAPRFRRDYTPPPEPSKAQFLEELRRLEGIPAEALDDPLSLGVILPALQADSALYRNYVYAEDAPFAFPIRAYGGAGDVHIRSEHLAAWAGETNASFAVRLFPGGHFFLHSGRADVLAAVTEDLEQAC
ncbi:MAG: thioesterase domain-containing protein [Bryobacteraceae bacterium]|jgi:surfactin synthase thioesterase subunit/glycosyltransferase involved in cell wall biosynthesis